MKLTRRFKRNFYATSLLLFASGVFVWAANIWFLVDEGFGPTPSKASVLALHTHAITGMLFFVVFGYLLGVHILPSMRRKKRLPSGYTCLVAVVFLCLTVPMLYYPPNELVKNYSAQIHTYLGLILPIFFFWHLLSKR